MAQRGAEHGVKYIERRLTAVEQILPTLATKTDLEAAVEDMGTEIQTAIATAIAPLATKAEVAEVKEELSAAIRAEGVETRRHFDVVAEGMRADVRMLAEGIVAVQSHGDTRHHHVMGTLNEHDRRLTRLEALPSKRR